MSSDQFARCMEAVALAVLPEFLGEPNRALSSPGREWRWGKNGSVSVDCVKGVYQDHEDGTGGGVLDLLQSYRGYTKIEAVEWLQEQGHIERRERQNEHANGQDAGSPQGKFAGFMDTWPVATFQYFDDKGRLAYEVLKFAKTAPRRYMQRRKHPAGKGWIWGLQGGTYGQVKSGDWFKAKEGKHYQAEETFDDAVRWLYHRDEVLKAKAGGRPVYLCEGEKDVETLRAWGLTATTNAGGAKYWTEAFDLDLAGADVVILPDNDETGQQRAMVRGAGLIGKSKSVRVLDISQHWKDAPEKADITDWKEAANGTAEQFAVMAKHAPLWKPERPKSRYNALEWSRLDDAGPELEFLVDGWLTEGERSVIGGPSKSGKSFLAIHLAMCVCRGQDFFDYPVKRGGVVYQAGEGAKGVKKRLKAYRKHFQVADDEDVPFVFLGSKVDLYSRDGDTQGLIDEIKAWALTMHEGDVSGTILSLGLGYEHLMLPMEYEPERQCRTSIGFVDPRKEDGELLFPERFPRHVVERDKIPLGSYAVAGQFQQRPAPRSGGMFQRGDFEIVDAVPAGAKRCRAWDFAASKPKPGKQPDWTVGLKMAYADGIFYIEDVRRDRWSPSDVEKNLKNAATQDGITVTIRMPQDPGAAGKADAATKVKLLAGYSVKVQPVSGDKATRATPASAQAEAGNVKLIRAPWNEPFLDELCSFPNGQHDDQVDAFADALNELALGSTYTLANIG